MQNFKKLLRERVECYRQKKMFPLPSPVALSIVGVCKRKPRQKTLNYCHVFESSFHLRLKLWSCKLAKKQNNPSWMFVIEVIMILHIIIKNASKFITDNSRTEKDMKKYFFRPYLKDSFL